MSPGVQYLKLNERYSYTDGTGLEKKLIDNDYSIINVRVLFEYQFIIANRFIINPYAGPVLTLGSSDAYGTGFSLNAGIDIGIGF